MENHSVFKLNRINDEFYKTNLSSFSATRHNPWSGWEKVGEAFAKAFIANKGKLREEEKHATLLDMACGNGRFLRFLKEEYPTISWYSVGVDRVVFVDEAEQDTQVEYDEFYIKDIVECMKDNTLTSFDEVSPSSFDYVVAFGILHHLPSMKLRLEFLNTLVSSLTAEGLLALSFWRFHDDEKLSAKAIDVTSQAPADLQELLGEGDFFLDWQGDNETLRFCHSFTENEIDDYIHALDATCSVVARYHADGKSNRLNTYVILQRK